MTMTRDMLEIDLRRRSQSIWIFAALGAVAIHAGGAALALSSARTDSALELGAPAIEIGVELLSPRRDPNDLPVGPDTAASPASPAIVEQKMVVEHRDLPRALPTETDDPDRVVTPNASKKPQEEVPKIAAVQAAPSVESAAIEETAIPTVATAIEAERSVTAALGTGESAVLARQTWQKELAAHLNKYKRYPSDRVMQRAEVVVSFVLDRLGRVLSTKIVKGSGDASFDAAATAMLQRANPVPPPPPLVADEGLTFSLPVIFHVKANETDAAAGPDHNPR
jgi:TonB family protein